MAADNKFQLDDDTLRNKAQQALQEEAEVIPNSTSSWDKLLANASVAPSDLILQVEDLKEGEQGFCYYLVPIVNPNGSIPVVILLDATTGELLESTGVEESVQTADGLNAIILVPAQQIKDQLLSIGFVTINGQRRPIKQVQIDQRSVWRHTRLTPLPYFPRYRMHVTFSDGLIQELSTFYVPISGLSLPTPPPGGLGEVPDLTPYTNYPGIKQ